MNDLPRILNSNYIPTDEDIFYLHRRTTTINQLQFESNKSSWMIVDVGGARGGLFLFVFFLFAFEYIIWIVCFVIYACFGLSNRA